MIINIRVSLLLTSC